MSQLPPNLSGPLELVTTIAKRKIGTRPSPATIWRHCLKGLQGGSVKLSAVKHSGRWYTTEKAYEQFIADQNPPKTEDDSPLDGDDPNDDDLRANGLL